MTNISLQAFAAPAVLRYTIRNSPIGQALVAATEQGVACVLLGDDKHSLLQDLARRYPQCVLDSGGAVLHGWSDRVLERLSRPASAAQDVPVQVLQGTAFQRQVWSALRMIPVGQTRSYQEVAQAMGCPQSVRALASACAANPLAVLVPCHRVLRSDGEMGGYRWGLERKRWLLEREGALEPHAAELQG